MCSWNRCRLTTALHHHLWKDSLPQSTVSVFRGSHSTPTSLSAPPNCASPASSRSWVVRFENLQNTVCVLSRSLSWHNWIQRSFCWCPAILKLPLSLPQCLQAAPWYGGRLLSIALVCMCTVSGLTWYLPGWISCKSPCQRPSDKTGELRFPFVDKKHFFFLAHLTFLRTSLILWGNTETSRRPHPAAEPGLTC